MSYSTNCEVNRPKTEFSPSNIKYPFSKYQSTLIINDNKSPLIYHKPIPMRNITPTSSKNSAKDLEAEIINRISIGESSIKDFKTGKPLFKGSVSVSPDKKGIKEKIPTETVLKMKIVKYKEIFNMLDSDKDGYISTKSIRLSVLGQDLLEALTPILEDLQKNKARMNFKQFCIKADRCLTVKILPFT